MNKSKDLEKYCNKMLLDFEILENSFLKLNNNTYEIVDGEQMLFDEDFNFMPITNHRVNGFVYEFCGRWYLQGLDENVTMQELKYIGNCKTPIETNSFIGVHSGNELLNGVGLYKDWVKKAKFLGVQNLGICEKNTLRGALSFQEICKKEGLRHIIGMSFSVNNNDEIFVVKCYCKDFQGWQNLLKFSYELNVEQNSAIKYDFLKDNLEGLYVIIDPKESVYKDYSEITDYYQLDTVKFEEEFKDASYIDNLELFLKSEMKPVLLCDAYYIEQSDYIAREKLWGIAKSFDYRTKNQHFKSDFEVLQELSEMFDNNTYKKLFEVSKSNLKDIVESCNFEYDTTSRHLPKYQMTKEESEKFKTKEDLFNHCLESGLSELDLSKEQKEEYLKRVNYEVSILKRGNVVDYFLFTRDLVNFAKKNDVLTGIARGCFVPNSLVKMGDKSQKKIQDIKVGDTVFNHFYGKVKVKNTFTYDVSEELVELDFGETKITCTKDHEILTKNRGWVNADKLTFDDEVVESKRQGGFLKTVKKLGCSEQDYIDLICGEFDYKKALNFTSKGFSSKLKYFDSCENCNKKYSLSVTHLKNSKYSKNYCNDCKVVLIPKLEECRLNNSKSQKIAQNKPLQKLSNKMNALNYWSKESSRKKASIYIRDRFKNDPSYANKVFDSYKNSGEVITKRFGLIKFQGLLELSFIIGCDSDLSVKTLKNYDLPPVQYFISKSDGYRSYYPDFICNGVVVEIKRDFSRISDSNRINQILTKKKFSEKLFGVDGYKIIQGYELSKYRRYKRKFVYRYGYNIKFYNEIKK